MICVIFVSYSWHIRVMLLSGQKTRSWTGPRLDFCTLATVSQGGGSAGRLFAGWGSFLQLFGGGVVGCAIRKRFHIWFHVALNGSRCTAQGRKVRCG